MAIYRHNSLYVVTIRGTGRGPLLVDAATTRDHAREVETAMIAALHEERPWPSVSPAKGTLAAVLRDAWRRPGGWHTKRTGPILYAFALEFVTSMGADRMAAEITEEGLRSYLVSRPNAELAARSVLQLLEVASDSGAASWRPGRRRGQSDQCPIALLQERHTTRTKFVRIANPGNGPVWLKTETVVSAWV